MVNVYEDTIMILILYTIYYYRFKLNNLMTNPLVYLFMKNICL